MKSSFIIILIFSLVIVVSSFKKVNCYDRFIYGIKEGAITVINTFSFFLTFTIAINLLNSCGIIELLMEKLNFKYGSLIVQALVRPVSSSSSMVIMLENFEKYGVDSFIGVMSTFIHSVSDTTIYIVGFYFNAVQITNYSKILKVGLLINIVGYLISVVIVKLIM